MIFESGQIALEVATLDEAAVDQLVANIVDEVPQDWSAVMARRIDMDDRIDADVNHSRVTKQSVDASADEEVDSLRGRIGCVGVEETGPRGQRRVADEGEKVRLETCHPAAWTHKRHHLADDALGLRHVDEDEPHVSTVERRSRQPRIVRIAFANLDLREPVVNNKTARLFDKVRAAFDAEDRSGRADTLTQQVQDTSRTAAKVDDALARA